jgi:hypothetical protein
VHRKAQSSKQLYPISYLRSQTLQIMIGVRRSIVRSIGVASRIRRESCPVSASRLLSSATSSSTFQDDWLNKRGAHNHVQLTPLTGMRKTIATHPTGVAYIHGDEKTTWREHGERCSAIASGLMKLGVNRGDVVSIIAPNSPSIFEAHFAVPGAGAVLNTINTRLDAKTVAYMVRYCQAKVLLVDSEHGKSSRSYSLCWRFAAIRYSAVRCAALHCPVCVTLRLLRCPTLL